MQRDSKQLTKLTTTDLKHTIEKPSDLREGRSNTTSSWTDKHRSNVQRLFGNLRAIYGQLWDGYVKEGMDGEDGMLIVWCKELNGLNSKQFKHGLFSIKAERLAAMRLGEPNYPPDYIKFRVFADSMPQPVEGAVDELESKVAPIGPKTDEQISENARCFDQMKRDLRDGAKRAAAAEAYKRRIERAYSRNAFTA